MLDFADLNRPASLMLRHQRSGRLRGCNRLNNKSISCAIEPCPPKFVGSLIEQRREGFASGNNPVRILEPTETPLRLSVMP